MPSSPATPPDQPTFLRSGEGMRVAHDFNNLLTGILGNLALVELELGPDTPLPVREKLQSAILAGERAADLIRQLFGFSPPPLAGSCSCPPNGEGPATPLPTETILVVDDDDLVRQVAATLFAKLGYQVRIATDGDECLRIFADGKEKIDLVLMDLTMPKMSGQETFRLLRRHHGPVPVLICSGDLVDMESFSCECGLRPEGFIHKPYRLDELASLVRSTLDARATRG